MTERRTFCADTGEVRVVDHDCVLLCAPQEARSKSNRTFLFERFACSYSAVKVCTADFADRYFNKLIYKDSVHKYLVRSPA